MNLSNVEILHVLAFRDAALCALGRASFELHRADSQLDLLAFMKSQILPELEVATTAKSTVSSLFRILRRRLAILLGQWFFFNKSATVNDFKSLIFPVLLRLQKDQDEVVRYSALWSIGQLIDAPGFNPIAILPYLSEIIVRIFQEFEASNELETRTDLLRTLSMLVEKLESDSRQFAELIVQKLPECWKSCEDQNVLRNSIIRTLDHLVRSLRHECIFLVPFILHVLQFSTDTDNSSS